MLKRKIEKKIEYWLEHKELKKAFMLTGARQVGKTYIIRSVMERLELNYPALEVRGILFPASQTHV